MMELKRAVALCEGEQKAAARERRSPRKRIVEKPGPNGATLWYEENGEPLVNLIWSSRDMQRGSKVTTTPSVMDRVQGVTK